MNFNSLSFILFFAAVFVLYYVLPHKARIPLMLAASLFFYACADVTMLVYLIAVTLITYFLAIVFEQICAKRKTDGKWIIVVGVVLEVLVLGIFKYTNFAISISNGLFGTGFNKVSLIAPLGISFITFSTISYLVDVYKGKLHAERNILKYALYVSFFPKIVQGPIEKAVDVLPQFEQEHPFSLKNVRAGFISALFGLFMKMVIADRAGMAVDTVFSDLTLYSGSSILLAVILFTIQLYADFAGYSLIAIGCAQTLGYTMKPNFMQPYFSVTASEFWRRWHSSLNIWLKDYIYIPLGGSRKGKIRKYVNLMIVFLVSGLWHGAGGGYILWGGINGLFVLCENIRTDLTKKRCAKTGKPVWDFPEWFNRIKTVVLVTFAWLFFRAQTLTNVKIALKKIFTSFNADLLRKTYYEMLMTPKTELLFGMNSYQYGILYLALFALFLVDRATYKGKLSSIQIAEGNRFARWVVLLSLIFAILIFGIYGYGYEASSFIYTAF